MFIKLTVFSLVIFGIVLVQSVFDRRVIKIDFSTVPRWKLFAHRVMLLLCGGAIASVLNYVFS